MPEIRSSAGVPPYLRVRETAVKMTWKKILALLPLAVSALIFYKMSALVLIFACVGAAFLGEALMGWKTKEKASAGDGQALLTGLLLALLLPPGLPAWMGALGAMIAVMLAGKAFGGAGHHPLSPVLVGYLFLSVSFPVAMRQALQPVTLEPAAFPLVWVKEGLGDSLPGFLTLLRGQVPGALGTTFFPAVVIGGALLLYQKLIFWEAPFLFLLAVAVTAFGFGEDPAAAIAFGTAAFAAFFLVPDGVNGPHHRHGLRFYALLTGFLSVALRQITFSFDPVPAALLLVSFVSPWLDESGRPEIRKDQKVRE